MAAAPVFDDWLQAESARTAPARTTGVKLRSADRFIVVPQMHGNASQARARDRRPPAARPSIACRETPTLWLLVPGDRFGRLRGGRDLGWYDSVLRACRPTPAAPYQLPGVSWFRRGYRSSAGHAEALVLVKPEHSQ